MSRRLRILAPLILILATACPLLPGSDGTDDGRDASGPADTLASDTATGPCTTHRDCFTKPGDRFACDPATGACVTPRLFLMPCDADDDCRTHYNTSLVHCGPANVCTIPCSNPGDNVGNTCPYGNRACSVQSFCTCQNDAACGEGNVCSTIAGMCIGKCLQDLDCVAMTGSTCDVATGQCVR